MKAALARLKALLFALTKAYWRFRLAGARRYRAELDHQQRWEREKAAYDVDYCRAKFARADFQLIEQRADRVAAEAAR